MGSCIICGTPVDGRICASHQEDVAFEFTGERPQQLTPGRFYRGTVDGYADFGVFVDIAPGVTGLLHRSELDQRLESLDWETGDEVYVQVKNVRDNGNIDLGWSIRQSDREFRGALVDDGETEFERDARGSEDSGGTGGVSDEGNGRSGDGSDAAAADDSGTATDTAAAADTAAAESEEAATAEISGTAETATTAETAETAEEPVEPERATVGSLSARVGDKVRLEGEVVSVRQTGGPTIFELRDETGIVDCAAFVEAGVRAYPDVEVGDAVRLDGDVELRREEIQVETEAIVVLEDDERDAVASRLSDALADKARPEAMKPLAGHEAVSEVAEQLLDVAEALRRAVLESRPIVVRHPATADGYVAGAAVERATLPLIRAEHAKSDAEYHYFTRRPLEETVYDMDAATNDVTQMLQDRDRHDEKIPLFLLVSTGSTVESLDGLGLLSVYGAERVVLDAAPADEDVANAVDALVNPSAEAAADLSTGALAADLAAAVNGDVREDLAHLPAVSYWEDTPDAYVELADEVGYDADRVAELREAVALEAYYQSYQDKRELITDILFEDAGDLAGHVSEQFREKLETEVRTAEANLDIEDRDGVTAALLDTDAFTHRFDFPPTSLLLDELHRRNRDGDDFVTVGVGTDELLIRSTSPVDLRAVADAVADSVPDADVAVAGLREGRIEFLSGRREDVREAVVEALGEPIAA